MREFAVEKIYMESEIVESVFLITVDFLVLLHVGNIVRVGACLDIDSFADFFIFFICFYLILFARYKCFQPLQLLIIFMYD